MKKILSILAIAALFFTSCGGDDDKTTPDPLTVNPTTITTDAVGAAKSFTITSTINWTVTSNAEWCIVDKTSGSNNATVAVTFSENTATTARTTTITVKNTENTITKTINVSQSGKVIIVPSIELSDDTFVDGKVTPTKKIAITANTKWVVSASSPDCTFSPANGTGNGVLSVSITENKTGGPRIVKLYIEDETRTIKDSIEFYQSYGQFSELQGPYILKFNNGSELEEMSVSLRQKEQNLSNFDLYLSFINIEIPFITFVTTANGAGYKITATLPQSAGKIRINSIDYNGGYFRASLNTSQQPIPDTNGDLTGISTNGTDLFNFADYGFWIVTSRSTGTEPEFLAMPGTMILTKTEDNGGGAIQQAAKTLSFDKNVRILKK